MFNPKRILLLLPCVLLLGCTVAQPDPIRVSVPTATSDGTVTEAAPEIIVDINATPLPTRTRWEYGTLLPYTVQTGDTLNALASRFATTAEEISAANPLLIPGLSTLPPGLELNIPARYIPFLGTSYQIIPNSELVYSPGAIDFDIQNAIIRYGGYLETVSQSSDGAIRPSWEIIERVGLQWGVNPRLLLAIMEYQTGVLRERDPGAAAETFPMGVEIEFREGLHKQLIWVAETLNEGYYGWRDGSLTEISVGDDEIIRIDPWQNAGTVALHYLFSQLYEGEAYRRVISPQGFGRTYEVLFGDPFDYATNHIPANLTQPELALPFEPGQTWVYSGGPHYAWGGSQPLASIDFAPPATSGGCVPSNAVVSAVGDGVIARREIGTAVFDLDGDGNELTGWVIIYLHVKTANIPLRGTTLFKDTPLSFPSCEGGSSTGTHLHLGRKYNGEWIPAGGPVPFTLGGWYPVAGAAPYEGLLKRDLPALELFAYPGVTDYNRITRPFRE